MEAYNFYNGRERRSSGSGLDRDRDRHAGGDLVHGVTSQYSVSVSNIIDPVHHGSTYSPVTTSLEDAYGYHSGSGSGHSYVALAQSHENVIRTLERRRNFENSRDPIEYEAGLNYHQQQPHSGHHVGHWGFHHGFPPQDNIIPVSPPALGSGFNIHGDHPHPLPNNPATNNRVYHQHHYKCNNNAANAPANNHIEIENQQQPNITSYPPHQNGGVHITHNLLYNHLQSHPGGGVQPTQHGQEGRTHEQYVAEGNLNGYIDHNNYPGVGREKAAAVVKQLQAKFNVGNGSVASKANHIADNHHHNLDLQRDLDLDLDLDLDVTVNLNGNGINVKQQLPIKSVHPMDTMDGGEFTLSRPPNLRAATAYDDHDKDGNSSGGSEGADSCGFHNLCCCNRTTTNIISESGGGSGGGGSRGLGMGGASSGPTNVGGGVNDGKFRSRDGGALGAYDYLKSIWIHCRLPLLILLVVALLIIFLLFSTAFIYLKYVPPRGFGAEEEPCEEMTCAFGASCVVENGKPSCRCPESCPSHYDPVCATDDITYNNQCKMRMFACDNHKSIRVRHPGRCETPDPCSRKTCHFGSRCIPTMDGRYATCECPMSCPDPTTLFGQSSSSAAAAAGGADSQAPVCGSDGKLYRNSCELDREACRWRRNITLKYVGKCDPCEDILCSAPQVCHLDEERRPICRCGEECTMDFNPVCGSDGKTYANECVMRQEACRSRRDLRIIYRGKCSSGVNPCESRTCRGYESCGINRFGIAQCTCAMKCDAIIQPVCGSDGKTYDNPCELSFTSCRDSRQILIAYRGTCEAASACAKHNCPPEATCVEKNGETVCECPVCPSDYEPVCGSDGVSYQNECRLRMEACLTNTNIHKIYAGLCNGCDHMQCDFYSVCQANMEEAKCVCLDNCTKQVTKSISTRVCGTDGVTYETECELQNAACHLQKFVVVASKGHCDLCANVQCKFGAKCENGSCICPTECPSSQEPVCGSNLMTYSNECELQKAACQLSKPLQVHFYGDCALGIHFQTGFRGGNGYGYGYGSGYTSTPASLDGNGNGGSGLIGQSQPKWNIQSPNPDSLPASSTSLLEGGTDGSSSSSDFKLGRSKLPCESIHCEFGGVCELAPDGFPRCTCQFNCSLGPVSAAVPAPVPVPVCASNLRLYASECEMKREACHRQTELRPRPMELCQDEERPTPTSSSSPPPPSLSLDKQEAGREGSPCEKLIFGCCPDGLTPASGPNQQGCPPGSPVSVCHCNKLGSMSEICDLITQECKCHRGVGGPKCDRCLPGFWGLTRTSDNGAAGAMPISPLPGISTTSFSRPGCLECGCSRFGSVREDCEQMTGRCVCKSGVVGHKCDSCSQGEYLGPYGCTRDSHNLGKSCVEIMCSFGADCEEDGSRAGCICNLQCSDLGEHEEVCGSDGFTYESECLVRRQSCRSQKLIRVLHKGSCPDSSESDGTESPLPGWTGVHYTEPGDDGMDLGGSDGSSGGVGGGGVGRDGGVGGRNGESWSGKGGTGSSSGQGFSSSGMKSTRHLPPQSKYQDLLHKHFYTHRSPTSATVQMRSYLGDSCQWTSDCITAHSMCLGGWCSCREGFYEDSERIQCKPIHSHLSGVLSCSKSVNLCPSPASCFDHRNGTYSCVCPLGQSHPHDRCSRKETLSPFLNGGSTITLDKLAGYHKLSLELEITPYLNYQHGILIFSSQHGNGSGDFLSLAIVDGFVEFRYDLGDGAAILRSSSRVISGSTHHIVAKRYNRDGLLRLDNDEDIKGTSPGTMKSLNLDHGGYMGFVPLNSTRIWEMVGTSEGFVGCIHKLRVGRRPIEFEEDKQDPLIRSILKVSQCPLMSSPYHRLSTTPMYTLYEAEGDADLNSDTDSDRPAHQGQGHGQALYDDGQNQNQISPLIYTQKRPTSNFENLSGNSGSGNGNGNSNNHNHNHQNKNFNNNNKGGGGGNGPKKNSCSTASPCQNHGVCWNDKSSSLGYKCVCHPEFTGTHCESKTSKIEESGAMLDFRGFSYLELPKIDNPARHVSIEMWLMIRNRNGIILYNGQETGKGDFVTLILTNGHVQFLFDLGSGMANITWSHPIALNKWHWIKAIRDGREASLQINGQLPITAKSPPTLSELNLELPLYVGGIRDINIVHRELGLLQSFDGVLQFVRVNGETYHREISSALRQRLVHRYEGPPCGTSVSPPCSNGGTCFPRLESFVCLCPAQFTGKTCDSRKETPGPVRFDGQSFLKFPRKIAKHESFNFSDYDEFYNENFDSPLDEFFGGSSWSKSASVDLSVGVGVGASDTDTDNEDYFSQDEKNSEYDDVYDFEDSSDFLEFIPLVREQQYQESDLDNERSKAQKRNRIEIVFRTSTESSGLILWTGKNPRANKGRSRKGYLGVFLVEGHVELRIELGAGRNKKPTIIRSKVKVTDGRWHQIVIARQRRLIVFQVDGSIPQRATAPVGSNLLLSDGRYWIGGIMPSILPSEIPASHHQGFVGCVDLVRIEKRRLPLSRIAYSTGVPLCDDDD